MKQLKNIGVFQFRNWHWLDVLTWHIKTNLGYVGYVYANTKMTLMVKKLILSFFIKILFGVFNVLFVVYSLAKNNLNNTYQ
jgi:hypothetical protein